MEMLCLNKTGHLIRRFPVKSQEIRVFKGRCGEGGGCRNDSKAFQAIDIMEYIGYCAAKSGNAMKKPTTLDKNLLKAAIKGDADAVDEMAQDGGDVETKDAMERTGMWHAAADGD